jgi:hypothetical protein
MQSYKAAPEIEVLSLSFPIPGFGVLPINAYVLEGSEPILVDTGAAFAREHFMAVLRSVIDPRELKWIWLTHTDFDHIGALTQLLADNSQLRVITTFRGVGIMSLFAPLPLDRVQLVNPGERITIGDRTLTAVVPPTYDNPSTTGFYDDKSRAFFSSDCFGALLSAIPSSAAEIPDKDLTEGQILWTTVDAPWLHDLDGAVFARELETVRKLEPSLVLSSHLPPAPGNMTGRLLASLESARAAPQFVGLDQAGLQHLLTELTGKA